ncbi:UPF0182 family membrane protein [Serinicoccus sp. LYQ131]|uniref:UPF0182 family membrane protein n=1 Tax=Serinicoccus sp. LYQ131 TaxID=3378797 RepID=UPI00386207D1
MSDGDPKNGPGPDESSSGMPGQRPTPGSGGAGSGGPSSAGGPGRGPGGGGPGGSGPSRPGRGRTGGMPRGRLIPTVLIVVAVVALVGWGATLWTDVLWYESLGFRQVLVTRLLTQVGLFVVAGALTGGIVWSGLWLAWRHRPIYAPSTPEQAALDRYRSALDPVRRLVFVAVPAVLGLFAGTAAAAQWQTVLLFINRQPFGEVDPEFGMDVGFFVFSLPFWQMVVSFGTLVLGLSLIGALLTHYIYGGVQLQPTSRGQRTTNAARIHLAVLLGLILVVRAGGYWIERFSLSMTQHARITGMTYTDATALLPTRSILAVAALLCAAFFIATIWTKAWRLPVIGLAGLLVVALVLGGAYPSLVQQFRVNPSEAQLEAPYIQRAIDSTLSAYGLEDIEMTDYNAVTEAEPGQLRSDADTIPGIRIVDPSVVSPTFRQLQGVRNYYQFPEALDVDRYEVDGELVDTVIAVRELNLDGISADQRNWVNDHTVYTHGFGVVASYGNRRSTEGEPILFEQNIPPVGALGDYEPRIYFGESSPDYSIVGAPEGQDDRELDYPVSGQETGEIRNTYSGGGGVAMGTFVRRAAYAIKHRQIEIMLSDSVNEESRMLDHREPRDRVERVAPWLRLDGNPYPAVVDGRVKWIVDGYTVSDRYPYSQMEELGEVTVDSLQSAANIEGIGPGQVNYIRNSVKATVDAYDGSVDLYAWDEEDPLLKAWSSAFDNSVQPLSAIDGELMSHLRYPEDLFKVQREVLSRYHVDDAGSFFTGQDFWAVSEDPSVEGDNQPDMPPHYLSVTMPGQEEPTFSLTTTYIPRGNERQNLTGYMAVDADAGTTAGERRDGYGQMRMLVLPRDTTVRGPGQFQNDINSSDANSDAFGQTLSQFLNLNRSSESSEVLLGNLLTLPVGGGLLYVEPVYVQAQGGNAYPLQRIVVVAFGNDLAWSDTLDGALDELFGGDSGATAGDAGDSGPVDEDGEVIDPIPGEGDEGSGEGETPEEPAEPVDPDGDLAQALADVEAAYEEGQEALADSDWVAYGEAQERLQEAIARAIEASPEGGSVSIEDGGGADDAAQTEAP